MLSEGQHEDDKWLQDGSSFQERLHRDMFGKKGLRYVASSSSFFFFWFTPYMCNHGKISFDYNTDTNPKCTLVWWDNDRDIWPHLLSLCNNKFLKGLRIAKRDAATYQLTNLLKSCVHTRHLTLINPVPPKITPSHKNSKMHMQHNTMYIPRKPQTEYRLHTRCCIQTSRPTKTHTTPHHPNCWIH